MTNLDSQGAYEFGLYLIGSQLDAISKLIENHIDMATNDNFNWGYVGDLRHVSAILSQVFNFLSNTDCED